MLDGLFYPSIRQIKTDSNEVFLTFDDGPMPGWTDDVLEVLSQFNVKATFFCIGNRAKENVNILRKMISAGHAIGNHSTNHDYSNYFKNQAVMEKWILDGEKTLLDLGAHEVVGFRPPAGIRTPVLHRAVRKLNQPLITWNYRFYDSTIPVSRKKFSVALKKIKAGDVILLHDVRKVNNREEFKTELTFFIQGLLEKGFQFSILTRGRCSAPLA